MKKVIAMLLAAVMVLSLAACGQSAAPAETEAAATQAAATQAPAATQAAATQTPTAGGEDYTGRVLKVAFQEGGNGIEHMMKLIEIFKAAHPGLEVEATYNPRIEEVIRPQMVAGNIPDVYQPDSTRDAVYTALLNENKLLDLTELFNEPGIDHEEPLKDQIIDGFLESTVCSPYRDGKIYCAPDSATARGLFYNKALFEENGWEVPKTWDEFFALGDKAKEKGYALFTYPGLYPDYLDSMLWPMLASAIGPDKVTELSNYGTGIITLPESRQIFANIAKIGQEGYLMEGTVGMNHTQTQADFLLNKALFIVNGDWLAQEMADAPKAEGFEYAMTTSPLLDASQTAYFRGSPGIMIVPADCAEPELAKEFIKYMYTDEVVKAWAQYGQKLAATKTAVKVSEGLLPADFLAAHEVDAVATALVFSWAPQNEGSKVPFKEVLYDSVADVMTGNMTADEWVDAVEDAMVRINAGE